MKKERILLSFIAAIIGLAVAGVAFYIYQTTKIIPPSKTKTALVKTPTPTPTASLYLVVDSPKDEQVFDKKTITVSGKTINNAIIVVSTNTNDEVIAPSKTGNFTTTMTIADGQNQVEVTAISPSGEETKVLRTVTFSTEVF